MGTGERSGNLHQAGSPGGARARRGPPLARHKDCRAGGEQQRSRPTLQAIAVAAGRVGATKCRPRVCSAPDQPARVLAEVCVLQHPGERTHLAGHRDLESDLRHAAGLKRPLHRPRARCPSECKLQRTARVVRAHHYSPGKCTNRRKTAVRLGSHLHLTSQHARHEPC